MKNQGVPAGEGVYGEQIRELFHWNVLKSFGFLAKYYSARSTLGIYRSFAGTGSYSIPCGQYSTDNGFGELLKYALSKTISRHPALCFGVVPKSDALEAHFVRLSQINWADVVEVKSFNVPIQEQDAVLERELGIAHEHIWEDQSRKPGWKLVVIKYENRSISSKQRVDMILPVHHGIADGGSGGAFHKTLFQYLTEGLAENDLSSEWPHIVPSDTALPISIEEAFPFPSEPRPQPRERESSKSKSLPWTAGPPSLPNINDFTSRAVFLTVPPENLTKTLLACRNLNMTMTSLLHAFILLYLSHTISLAKSFEAVTPYSMRRFTGIPEDEMINHISFIVSHWNDDLVIALRQASTEGSKEETDVLLRVAGQFRQEITDELASIPQYGSGSLRTVSQIPDYYAMCRAGVEKNRLEQTYEISNIGLVKVPNNEGGDDKLKLEKFLFSQCGMVAGPAFGVHVASVAKGPMAISLTWQEGIIKEDIVVGLRDYLQRRLSTFGKESRE